MTAPDSRVPRLLLLSATTPRQRAGAFARGLGVNLGMVAFLMTIGVGVPTPDAGPRFSSRILIAPAPPAAGPALPSPKPKLRPPAFHPPPARPQASHAITLPPPVPPVPALEVRPIPAAVAPAPRMQPVVGTFEQPEVAARSAPPPSVAARTGDFSTASLTAATGRRSSAVAADAGFGTAEAASTRRDNAALVRPSGFGAPELSDRSSLPAPRSTAGAGFDAPIVPSRHAAKPAAQPPPPAVTPVQILNKPKPRYTEEARRLMIEGEVWLEILFGARGTVTVQRVVRTLGHGLDESAISAAARIQFRPAESNGVPVDQSAIVRVQFQLAN